MENRERTQRTGETRFITLLLRAETEGAALRAALMELESDEAASCAKPPGELLLPCGALAYGDIRAALRSGKHGLFSEAANYRIARDGAFIHRVVRTPKPRILLSSVTEQFGETPYAIHRRLQCGV